MYFKQVVNILCTHVKYKIIHIYANNRIEVIENGSITTNTGVIRNITSTHTSKIWLQFCYYWPCSPVICLTSICMVSSVNVMATLDALFSPRCIVNIENGYARKILRVSTEFCLTNRRVFRIYIAIHWNFCKVCILYIDIYNCG